MDFLPLVLLDDPVHKVTELYPATAFVVLAYDVAGVDVQRGE